MRARGPKEERADSPTRRMSFHGWFPGKQALFLNYCDTSVLTEIAVWLIYRTPIRLKIISRRENGGGPKLAPFPDGELYYDRSAKFGIYGACWGWVVFIFTIGGLVFKMAGGYLNLDFRGFDVYGSPGH